MGGSIAIAARFNDGQAVCVDGWTNFIPRMVMNATTLSGNDAVVREMLIEVAAHPSYAGVQPFRPRGYGIVVIDFVAREIHSRQGYTSFTDKTLNQLLDLGASGWKDGVFTNVLSAEADDLLEAGRVRQVAVDGAACNPVTLTRDMALAMLDADTRTFLQGGTRTYVELLIDTAPFTVHDHPEDASIAAMRMHLATTGFPLTRHDGLNAMLPRRARTQA